MQYAVIIEREPGSDSVSVYSPDDDINVYLVRDAHLTDDELIADFKEALDLLFETLRDEGLPVPAPQYRVAMVTA